MNIFDKLFGGLSMACDFADLAAVRAYLVTASPGRMSSAIAW